MSDSNTAVKLAHNKMCVVVVLPDGNYFISLILYVHIMIMLFTVCAIEMFSYLETCALNPACDFP